MSLMQDQIEALRQANAQREEEMRRPQSLIRMAKEARLPYEYDTGRVMHLKELERFAEFVRAPRIWVSLTDEEIIETIGGITNYRGEYEIAVGRAIEVKLREKNNVLG